MAIQIRFKFVLLMVMLHAAFVGSTLAQQGDPKPEPVLVDEFGGLGDCEFRSRIDSFLAELSEKPDHHGYIINYKSANELPDLRDKHGREMTISNHISFRNFDSSRITQVRGGYRDEFATELWIIPPGGSLPKPSRTVPQTPIPVDKTFLYARSEFDEYDEWPDSVDEFVLTSVREKEAEESAADDAKWAAENEEKDGGDAGSNEPANATTAAVDAPESPELPVEELTDAEKREIRFGWADVGLARYLSERPGAKGVIIFYADDQRYDIGRFLQFVEEGRDLLAERGNIPSTRLRIEFGGYRETPGVEFWFVPKRGKAPVPQPEQRRVEKPDTEEN